MLLLCRSRRMYLLTVLYEYDAASRRSRPRCNGCQCELAWPAGRNYEGFNLVHCFTPGGTCKACCAVLQTNPP